MILDCLNVVGSLMEVSVLATTKVTNSGGIAVPEQVRAWLGMHPGDMVTFDASGDTVILRRLASGDAITRLSFTGMYDEWDSPEDDAAFSHL